MIGLNGMCLANNCNNKRLGLYHILAALIVCTAGTILSEKREHTKRNGKIRHLFKSLKNVCFPPDPK